MGIRRRAIPWLASVATLVVASRNDRQAWPLPAAELPDRNAASPLDPPAPLAEDDSRLRRQGVCVATPSRDAAVLSDHVVYRMRREGDRLIASYFLHWSTERPWGDHPVAAALFIDAVYSHLLFVLPGLRYWLYGPGDVEGATVVYRDAGDGLEAVEGFADGEWHEPTRLGPIDLATGDGRTALMTRAWSHQLGARGAARQVDHGPDQDTQVKCFDPADFVPLTPAIAERFRLGSESSPERARPAWR